MPNTRYFTRAITLAFVLVANPASAQFGGVNRDAFETSIDPRDKLVDGNGLSLNGGMVSIPATLNATLSRYRSEQGSRGERTLTLRYEATDYAGTKGGLFGSCHFTITEFAKDTSLPQDLLNGITAGTTGKKGLAQSRWDSIGPGQVIEPLSPVPRGRVVSFRGMKEGPARRDGARQFYKMQSMGFNAGRQSYLVDRYCTSSTPALTAKAYETLKFVAKVDGQ